MTHDSSDDGPTYQTRSVLEDVSWERAAQDAKWGQQDHPDGTGAFKPEAERAKGMCELAFQHGYGSWRHILLEEVYESLAEEQEDALEEELIQVAAVAVAWVEAIRRRRG